jgi:phosphate:Na+ symporter
MISPFLLVSFIGGLALLLYGLSLSATALKDTMGGRLGGRMTRVLKSRSLSACLGGLLTALVQSSNAITVILVGLARTQAISVAQAIPLLLGANMGATLTVQLIAFNFYELSPLIIAVGFFIASYARRKRVKSIGTSILGLGFIFLGLHLLTVGLRPLSAYPWVREGLLILQDWPLPVMIISAVLTAFLHSCAATLGIAIALGSEGIITLQNVIPIVLGANIGTCATAGMASLHGPVEGKRVAVAHVLIKLLGVALLAPFMAPFTDYLTGMAQTLPRQIAYAHTLFNLGLLVLFLPLSTFLAVGVTRWVTAPPSEEDLSRPKYLDLKLLDVPAVALEQAARESLRMAAIVREMLYDTKRLLIPENNRMDMRKIKQREEVVDHLNREIKLYLIKLSPGLSEKESARKMTLINFISHLENIGDIIDDNLLELGEKKIEEGARFSEVGLTELHLFHHGVCQDFDEVVAAFETDQKERAQQVIEGRGSFHQRVHEMRAAHIERLHQGASQTMASSAIHLDFITHFARIRSHITAIAHTLVEEE